MNILHKALDWLGRWGKTIISAAGAAVAFTGAYWGALIEGNPVLQYAFFIGGLLGALTTVLVPIAETRAKNRKIIELETTVVTAKGEGRQELILLMDYTLRPLLLSLGTVAQGRTPSKRSSMAEQLKMIGLIAIRGVISPSTDRLRANYYKLKYPEAGGSYLLATGSTATAPRQRFELLSGTEEADALLEMLAQDTYVFTEDCVENPPKGFDPTRPRSYRTFISAAANDGIDVTGMVTVDSPDAGSLTEADATLVQLIATIISISEAIKDGKKADAAEL